MIPRGVEVWSRFLHHGTPHLLLLSLPAIIVPVLSVTVPVNVTVDDQLGDPTTGLSPVYSPKTGSWHLGSPEEDCPSCSIQPSMLDLTKIHDETWLDATYWPPDGPATLTFQFTGTAVYVFNIVPNTLPADTFIDISFTVDEGEATTFIHSPDSSSIILYNYLVYQNTGLDYGPHTLVMKPANSSLVLFDYLIYTTQHDEDNPSSVSSSKLTSDSTSSSPSTSTSPPSSSATPTSTSTPASSQPQSLSPSRPLTSTSTSNSTLQSSLSGTPSSATAPSTPFPFLFSSTPTSISTGPSSSQPVSSSSSHTPVGSIVGPVLGGIGLLLGVAVGVFVLGRRCRRSRATRQLLASTADDGFESDYDRPGVPGDDETKDRRGRGASLVQSMSVVSTTPISPLRFLDVASTQYDGLPSVASSNVPSPEGSRPLSLGPSVAPSAAVILDRSSKHRAELAWRLETLQRTRSVLSSATRPSRSEDGSGSGIQRGTETAIQNLEAEIAELRATLTALNARLEDEHRGGASEFLPAYAE